jgi:hypothetical protein
MPGSHVTQCVAPGIPRIKSGVSPGYVNRLRIASNPQLSIA